MRPVVVLHGGTGNRRAAARAEQIRRHLRRILDRTHRYALTHSALETVVYGACLLEDDPLFNAGTGSALQRDGAARMSASVMDGATRRFAGVLNVERIRHPVRVAEALLGQPEHVLAGAPARRFAQSLGMDTWDPVTPARRRQWLKRVRGAHGTIGVVALDRDGRLAAATSTGGRGFELPGRVSDSGTPAGNYATDLVAISATGTGEDIIDEGLAARIAQQVADGRTVAASMQRTMVELRARNRAAGLIALDRSGRWSWSTTLPVLFAAARSAHRRVESF
jgi:L-asparaginase